MKLSLIWKQRVKFSSEIQAGFEHEKVGQTTIDNILWSYVKLVKSSNR